MKLSFYKMRKNADLPVFSTDGSACFDLTYQPDYDNPKLKVFRPTNNEIERDLNRDSMALIVMPFERVLVPTGLIADIPEGHSIRFHPRSSVAIKRGLTLANAEAVIDSDYVHELFVALYNMTEQKVIIHPGERIGQGELVQDLQYEIAETKKRPSQKTNRTGGIGSTGK